jgi:hypothetical protein
MLSVERARVVAAFPLAFERRSDTRVGDWAKPRLDMDFVGELGLPGIVTYSVTRIEAFFRVRDFGSWWLLAGTIGGWLMEERGLFIVPVISVGIFGPVIPAHCGGTLADMAQYDWWPCAKWCTLLVEGFKYAP